MSSKSKPLPQFVPYPPIEVRKSLPPETWQPTLDIWSTLSRLYLESSPGKLKEALEDSHSLTPFLKSFVSQEADLHGSSLAISHNTPLYLHIFLLVDRFFREVPKASNTLAEFRFLGDFCTVYTSSPAASPSKCKHCIVCFRPRCKIHVSHTANFPVRTAC